MAEDHAEVTLVFRGKTRDDAEKNRDRYFADYPAELQRFNSNPSLAIELRWDDGESPGRG